MQWTVSKMHAFMRSIRCSLWIYVHIRESPAAEEQVNFGLGTGTQQYPPKRVGRNYGIIEAFSFVFCIWFL